MSAETREKIRQAKLGKPNPGAKYTRSPETRAKNRQGRLGKAHSEDSRRKASESHKRTWQDPEYRAKVIAPKPEPLPPEERKALGRSRVRAANLGRKDSLERREKVRQGVLAAYAARPEIIERIREARKGQVFPKRNTTLELVLGAEFGRLGLQFSMHTAFGKYHPDFTFENARLFVEADSSYWHSRPEVAANDIRFAAAAAAAGWTVLRFNDNQIKQDPAACAAIVLSQVHPPKGANTDASAMPSY